MEFTITSQGAINTYDMHSHYKVLNTWAYDKTSQMFTLKDGPEIYTLLEMRLGTGKKH